MLFDFKLMNSERTKLVFFCIPISVTSNNSEFSKVTVR